MKFRIKKPRPQIDPKKICEKCGIAIFTPKDKLNGQYYVRCCCVEGGIRRA